MGEKYKMRRYLNLFFVIAVPFCMGAFLRTCDKNLDVTPTEALSLVEREENSYFLILETKTQEYGIGIRVERRQILILFRDAYWKIHTDERRAYALSDTEREAVIDATKNVFVLEKIASYDVFINVDKFLDNNMRFVLIDDYRKGYYFRVQTRDFMDPEEVNMYFRYPFPELKIEKHSWVLSDIFDVMKTDKTKSAIKKDTSGTNAY